MDRTEETIEVQTEITTTLYIRLKTAEAAKDMTLKEATREAITDFTFRHHPIETKDPIFAPLDWEPSREQSEPLSETVDTAVYDKLSDVDI